MLKKFAILGLVLLLAGTAALGWVVIEKRKEQQWLACYKQKYESEPDEYIKQYNEWLQLAPEERALAPWGLNESGKTKTEAQLQLEQRERLKADLDKLAAGETYIHPSADVLYGDNWQNELSKYRKQKELKEFILTGSIAFAFTGGAIFTCCLLLWTSRLVIRVLSHWQCFQTLLLTLSVPPGKFFTNVFRNRETKDKKLVKADTKKCWINPRQKQKSQLKKHSKVLINSGWQNFDTDFVDRKEPASAQTAFSIANENCPDYWNTKHGKKRPGTPKITVLLSDEQSSDSEGTLRPARDNMILNTTHLDTSKNAEGTALLDSRENSLKLEDVLNAQTETLEKQLEEFRQLAQSVQQTAFEHSKPLNNAIGELMQQVSAIREYAAYQQDRVEKLQDGYDWNIIRTFCLRVIRCIDNLENRINQLSKQKMKTSDLEEVRDELLFALESSGVEQFEPELNSDYRNQEKFAEAVKDKQPCNDPKQTGKIAKVIRSGYQYFINEDNVKVVRTAQVKLFG